MSLPVISDTANARQVGESLAEAATSLRGIMALPQEERSENTSREAQELRQFITDADSVHKALMASERAAYVPESRGPSAAFDQPGERYRSLGELVTEHDSIRGSQHPAWNTNSTEIKFERALLSEADPDNHNADLFIAPPQRKPINPLTRRLFVREFLSHINTTAPSLAYMQETNIAANELGANVTAEGALKNEVVLDWVEKLAPVRKITAWLPLTEEIIEDAPALRGYIDNRLLYMLKLREELQFLKGSGAGANITGILNTIGIQEQDAIAGDIPATIAASLAKIANVDGEGTAVAMNPLDFWGAVATRHEAQFDNGYGGNAPASVSSITWGLPVATSRTLLPTESIVADWAQGGTVIDRKEATIEVGMQHADYFLTNKVAVRAEERTGLAIDRPSFFVSTEIDLTA